MLLSSKTSTTVSSEKNKVSMSLNQFFMRTGTYDHYFNFMGSSINDVLSRPEGEGEKLKDSDFFLISKKKLGGQGEEGRGWIKTISPRALIGLLVRNGYSDSFWGLKVYF